MLTYLMRPFSDRGNTFVAGLIIGVSVGFASFVVLTDIKNDNWFFATIALEGTIIVAAIVLIYRMICRSNDKAEDSEKSRKHTASECLKLSQQALFHFLGLIYDYNRIDDSEPILPTLKRPDPVEMRSLAVDIGHFDRDLRKLMEDIAFKIDEIKGAVDPDHEYEIADDTYPLAQQLTDALTKLAYL